MLAAIVIRHLYSQSAIKSIFFCFSWTLYFWDYGTLHYKIGSVATNIYLFLLKQSMWDVLQK